MTSHMFAKTTHVVILPRGFAHENIPVMYIPRQTDTRLMACFPEQPG